MRPRSWFVTIAGGIAFGVGLKLVLKSVIMPLLGAPATNAAYQHLVGNTAALPEMMGLVIVGAGFGEETVFRGFLFERLGRLLGRGPVATVATIALTAAWFGVVHLPGQGVPGAQQAALLGLLFGTIFARTRALWFLVVAHAAFDIAAVFIIYLDLETRIAHLFFG